MLTVVLTLFGLSLFGIIGANFYSTSFLPDAEEQNGRKRYADIPGVRLVMRASSLVGLIGLVVLIWSTNNNAWTFNWFIMIGVAALLGYEIFVESPKRAKNYLEFNPTEVRWRHGSIEDSIEYTQIATAYLPKFSSLKRYFSQGRGQYILTLTDHNGNVKSIAPAELSSGSGTRFVYAEFRKRLDARGIPYKV